MDGVAWIALASVIAAYIAVRMVRRVRRQTWPHCKRVCGGVCMALSWIAFIEFSILSSMAFGFTARRPDLYWPLIVAGACIGWIYHRILTEEE